MTHLRPRARRGVNAIEFALTLPVFLLCTLGAFDLVFLLFQDNTLALALDDACRATALDDPTAPLPTILADELDRSFASFGLQTCPECLVTAVVQGVAPERRLVCDAVRTVAPITGYFLGDTTLEARASTWMERQNP